MPITCFMEKESIDLVGLEQLWHMTQMARWVTRRFPGTGWKSWNGVSGEVFTQARELGLLDTRHHRAYPAAYGTFLNAETITSLKIKRDFSIAEVVIDSRPDSR